jgi:hypothetical protein
MVRGRAKKIRIGAVRLEGALLPEKAARLISCENIGGRAFGITVEDDTRDSAVSISDDDVSLHVILGGHRNSFGLAVDGHARVPLENSKLSCLALRSCQLLP